MVHNLTLTSAVFDVTTQKFGSGALSGGYGTAAAVVSGFPVTVEAWVKNTSSAAGPFIAAGIDNSCWIGVGSGKVAVGGTSAVTTPLIDGVWHHLAATWFSASSLSVFLDGTQVFTTTTANVTAPGAASTRVGNLTFGSSVNAFQWPGEVDEAVFWSTGRYSASFTAPTGAYVGNEPGLAALYHLDSNGTDASIPPLSIGSLTTAAAASNIALTLSSAVANGSGSGYSFSVYRGTDPAFLLNSGSLLASGQTGTSYVDTTATQGVQYYYAVVATDSGGNAAFACPAGINPLSGAPSLPLYASTSLWTSFLNMVFVGDSITYGAGLSGAGTMATPTAPGYLFQRIHKLLGLRSGAGSNQGSTGTTTYDWRPGGTLYAGAKSALQALVAQNPGGLQCFNVMLGTNDSAQVGTNNGSGGVAITGSLSPANYKANLNAIVGQMLSDFPSCKIMLHHPPYYTPNTRNTAIYEQNGLAALASYNAQITTIASAFASSNPGQVFEGDGFAFSYFAQNYAAELQADTSGPNGTFYLHPNATGAQSLGEFWASAWANALYGVGYGALPLTSVVNPPDLVTLTQGGVAKQVAASTLKSYLNAGGA